MGKTEAVKNEQFCGISWTHETTTINNNNKKKNGFCSHLCRTGCCRSRSTDDMNDYCHRKCPPPYDVLCFYLKRWYSRLAIIFGYIAIILISLILLLCAGFFTTHS
ncbi:hypothetical protein BLA29_013666 [Euroglyphus maynei]|uniref:Uncharacterized protein n=1 Tax=Euroglyphus maynei TaxID=6958 RepID=A0A1Y3AUU6_EURMA|nr:hypothetical protein BLA29_013666 [Euroglyphus maynei]